MKSLMYHVSFCVKLIVTSLCSAVFSVFTATVSFSYLWSQQSAHLPLILGQPRFLSITWFFSIFVASTYHCSGSATCKYIDAYIHNEILQQMMCASLYVITYIQCTMFIITRLSLIFATGLLFFLSCNSLNHTWAGRRHHLSSEESYCFHVKN